MLQKNGENQNGFSGTVKEKNIETGWCTLEKYFYAVWCEFSISGFKSGDESPDLGDRNSVSEFFSTVRFPDTVMAFPNGTAEIQGLFLSTNTCNGGAG